MHNIMMTARDSPVRGRFSEWFPTLGRVAGRVRLQILYSTQRMDNDRCSPQFTALGEDNRVFFSRRLPHAHCKVPGTLPILFPVSSRGPSRHPSKQVLDLWGPPGSLDGWAPATR